MSWISYGFLPSGIARGRVRTTTVESRKMAAILQMIGRQRHAALVYRVLLRIYDIMSWSTDTCQIKLSADPYHVTISRAQVYSSSRHVFYWNWSLTKCRFLIGSRAHVRLTYWKQRWVVRKPVNSNPGLKVNQVITVSSIEILFCVSVLWLLSSG